MLLINIIFVLWVLLSGLRGVFRGFYLTLFGLIGLISAYVASLLLGHSLVELLEKQGVSRSLSLFIGFPLFFLLVNISIATLPKTLLRGLLVKKGRFSLAGGALGSVIGVLSGLIIIWCFSFVQGAFPAVSKQITALLPLGSAPLNGTDSKETGEPPALLKTASGQLMGETVELGARWMGKDEPTAKVMSAAASNPEVLMASVQTLTKSDELKRLMFDPLAQRYMAMKQTDLLVADEGFQALMENPAMKKLGELALDEFSEDKEIIIAEKISYLWRRLHYLKNDPQISSILKDPEVQQLANNNNPAALLVNPKVQTLIEVVMQEDPGFESYDFTQFVGDGVEGHQISDMEQNKSSTVIYQWYDDEGKVRYSDRYNIPDDKIDSAVSISE